MSNAEIVHPVHTSVNAQHTYTELMSLAYELCEAEGLTLANAIQIAADDLGILKAVAEQWDRRAFHAGNDDALPF